MAKEQHTWGHEQRRDGSSEWPSTGFATSTLSGELRDSRGPRQRRRHRRSPYVGLLLPLLLVLALGGLGVLGLARHFQG